MVNKNSFLWIFLAVVIVATGACMFCLNRSGEKILNSVENQDKKPVQIKSQTEQKEPEIKSDLYSNTPYNLPLISIVDISKLPPKIKQSVDEILETAQGFYYLKYNDHNKEVDIILQNPVSEGDTYSRHNLEFAHISSDGNITYKRKGYTGEDGETANAVTSDGDFWEFDTSVEPNRPLKHIVYEKKNKIKFEETWNYDEKEPVKYEMKDGKGKTISIMKETVENESNFRKEHIFYDHEGNTEMSVSANYDGAEISRFTYYNADKNDGITIISEISDGTKNKEQIYNKDYELQATVVADYKDGVREDIKLMDKDGKEVEKLSN